MPCTKGLGIEMGGILLLLLRDLTAPKARERGACNRVRERGGAIYRTKHAPVQPLALEKKERKKKEKQ